MVRFVHNYSIEGSGVKFSQSARLQKRLVRCDSTKYQQGRSMVRDTTYALERWGIDVAFWSDGEEIYGVSRTHKSACPEALCFAPCSISTLRPGHSFSIWAAACLASSMLFTMIKERVVASSTRNWWNNRESKVIKTVVLPEPVGRDTPIREEPAFNASRHASMQDSWYGRNETGTLVCAFRRHRRVLLLDCCNRAIHSIECHRDGGRKERRILAR